MTKLKHFIWAVVCGAALLLHANAGAQPMFGPSVPVQGQVISRAQGPVPGVTAFLIHPILGRSAPTFTDAGGRFGWAAIPIRAEPYFLEVYWGPNLIYREPVQVMRPMQLPPIVL
jgi:hypothetical protein